MKGKLKCPVSGKIKNPLKAKKGMNKQHAKNLAASGVREPRSAVGFKGKI